MTSAADMFDPLISRLGLQLRRHGRELVSACPKCGGRDRFAINIAKQLWNCRGCGRGGDPIDLVRHVEGRSFSEARKILSGRGNGADYERHQSHARRYFSPINEDNVFAAERIWRQTTPLGPDAIAYFCRRGIDIEAVPEYGGLRWHSRCPWESTTKRCVIGRYTTALGNEPRGVWRRPIDGGKPKALGPTAGCIIRLWPDEAVEGGLALGEGVETVLAAATRIEHRGTLLQPAWASGSAGNMANFPVLSGIEALTLLIDNDASGAGQRASEECRARWVAAGREVTALIPNISNSDFNNLVMR